MEWRRIRKEGRAQNKKAALSCKVEEYYHNGDHGCICLAENPRPKSIAFIKEVVEDIKVSFEGATYRFRAYGHDEMPKYVQLSFQMKKKYHLEENDPKGSAQELLDIMVTDNFLPGQEKESEGKLHLVSADWCKYVDGQGNPTGQGCWLVRFRCLAATAYYIRDECKGDLQANAVVVKIRHEAKAWAGRTRPRLLHLDEPAQPVSPTIPPRGATGENPQGAPGGAQGNP